LLGRTNPRPQPELGRPGDPRRPHPAAADEARNLVLDLGEREARMAEFLEPDSAPRGAWNRVEV
jgi:hypothetical protein